jgi:hypothetical protein
VLTATLPPSRVANQLRFGWGDLKKRLGLRHATSAALAPLLGCVEVPPTPTWPQTAPATQLEVPRTDGTRLCLHSHESTLPLAAMVRAFVEERHPCCN